jgi:hypothetical protein
MSEEAIGANFGGEAAAAGALAFGATPPAPHGVAAASPSAMAPPWYRLADRAAIAAQSPGFWAAFHRELAQAARPPGPSLEIAG